MSYLSTSACNESFTPELREVLLAIVKELESIKTRLSGLEQKVSQVQDASRSAQHDP